MYSSIDYPGEPNVITASIKKEGEGQWQRGQNVMIEMEADMLGDMSLRKAGS